MFPSVNRYHRPDPQHSAIGLISSAQASETQPTLLPLQITGTYPDDPALIILELLPPPVLRAHNLPRLKTLLGKKRQFYVTVTYGESAKRTRSVRSVAQRVEWNEAVDALCEISYSNSYIQLNISSAVRPLSRITVSLYAVKTTKKQDILIGREEIPYEPRRGSSIS
jgi:hypothetical protein